MERTRRHRLRHAALRRISTTERERHADSVASDASCSHRVLIGEDDDDDDGDDADGDVDVDEDGDDEGDEDDEDAADVTVAAVVDSSTPDDLLSLEASSIP